MTSSSADDGMAQSQILLGRPVWNTGASSSTKNLPPALQPRCAKTSCYLARRLGDLPNPQRERLDFCNHLE